MREILFRGKRKNNGEWVYGFVLNAEYTLIGYYKNGHDFCIVEVIPETVGQYTGLKDNKGNKIFENDIVMDAYGEELKVVFAEESPWICTVIGNEIDNPEVWEAIE